MPNTAQDRYVAFARRYSDPTMNYLSADIAVARMDVLLDDLRELTELFDGDKPRAERWAPWFGAEIISYYAVAFATCLEWHARSRFVDLLTFRPESIRPEDTRELKDKLIVRAISENTSVTHLIGASLSVSNFETYLAIMERVFEGIGVKDSIGDWLTGSLKGAKACWLEQDQFASIHELFRFRHSLVHELGIETMGHPNVRESWSPDTAMEIGGVVASAIRGIESVITRFAPSSFPNLLTEEGWPISPLVNMEAEMLRLEEIADSEVRKEWTDERTIAAWDAASAAAKTHLEAEKNFIDDAAMLHWRYFDARLPLKMNALRSRTAFLKELLDNFSTAHLDNPNAEIPASLR